MDLYPSILSADFSRLQEEIDRASPWAQGWHIDIMDGHFVPNLSCGAPVMACLKTELPLDVHLMVENPQMHIEDCYRAGADSITVHVETAPHLHRLIEQIHHRGMKAGVALNPLTPLVQIEEALEYIDLVLIMTVNPGFSGQRMIEGVLQKLSALRSQMPELEIRVDGGVTRENAISIKDAGASSVVSGSAFWGSQSLEEASRDLRGMGEKT